MFYSFCSVVEAKKREFEHDVHVLEATESTAALNPGRRRFDPEKIVAKYYRSGTSNAFKGAEARSFECLERTLHYILDEIWRPAHVAFEKSQGSWQGASGSSRKMDDLLLRYNFCMDRIAAVRQDITIQRYTCVRTRALLIRIAEFYLNAMVAVNYAPCNGLICNLPPNSFDMKNHEHALNVVLASIQQFTDMSFLNLQTGAIADASSPTPTGYSERSMYYQAVVVTLFLGLCKSISTSYSRATSVAASSDSMADAKKKNVIALDASVGSLMHSYRTELLALVRWRHSDTDSDLTGDALLMGHLQVLATKLLYPMVAYVRQGNPSRAMKVARKYIGTSFGGRESGLSAACESVSWQLGVILFTYALPELRLWRLFLLYATSNVTNHGTVINKLDQGLMRSFLQVSSGEAASRFCALCGFDVRDSEIEGGIPSKDVYLSSWSSGDSSTPPSTKFTVSAVWGRDERQLLSVVDDPDSSGLWTNTQLIRDYSSVDQKWTNWRQ